MKIGVVCRRRRERKFKIMWLKSQIIISSREFVHRVEEFIGERGGKFE